ncbi:hypothetical protein SEA_NEDWONG_199 [Mycobacterium phage NedWong]|nr:hypothetical protein SEA_NEDWONG_199 [Mycobacterium phage NedWong]
MREEAHEEMTAPAHPLAEEPYMPRPGDIDIGLKNDQIMQRYLVRRIHREVEFTIKEMDGDIVTGFITGFDDKCIQMSTTPRNSAEEPMSVLLFWPIRKIAETGRKITDLEHEHRTKIRSYSHALRAQCDAYLNGSRGRTQSSSAPRRLMPAEDVD